MKKQIISGIITAGLVLSLSVPVLALELTIKDSVSSQQTSTISFRDIPSSHWAYGAISTMTAKGLFGGKVVYDDNTALFAPDDTMTRAEFVTVVMRALYQDELNAMPSNPNWWANSYDLAVDKGILKSSELDSGVMDKGMTRQEMALVLVRATEQLGQYPSQLVDTSKIADYNTVGTYYRDSVVKAYSMGMLAGTDAKGTYSPQATLNRDAGATVLNRLVDVSAREKVDFSTPSETVVGSITIREGEQSVRRLAKAGDTVIKEDGTKVVLTTTRVGSYDILGFGQGVAPDLGVISPNGHHTVQDSKAYLFGYDLGQDSTGTNVKQSAYYTNKLTGEGHWSKEWSTILQASKPTSPGTKDMQLTADKNWVWVESNQDWYSVPGTNIF